MAEFTDWPISEVNVHIIVLVNYTSIFINLKVIK